MFEMDIEASVASEQLKLHGNTVSSFYNQLRRIISDFNYKVDSTYNDLLKKNSPTFSITITDKKVIVGIKDESIESKGEFLLVRTRVPSKEVSFLFDYKRIKRLMYNDKLENFPVDADHFFRFAKMKLLKYRGTKLKYLLLYLKEIEFRYNNKNENLFNMIIAKLACFEGWSDSVKVSEK